MRRTAVWLALLVGCSACGAPATNPGARVGNHVTAAASAAPTSAPAPATNKVSAVPVAGAFCDVVSAELLRVVLPKVSPVGRTDSSVAGEEGCAFGAAQSPRGSLYLRRTDVSAFEAAGSGSHETPEAYVRAHINIELETDTSLFAHPPGPWDYAAQSYYDGGGKYLKGYEADWARGPFAYHLIIQSATVTAVQGYTALLRIGVAEKHA